MKFIQHFLPHPKTHEKSHFLHWHFLLVYILLFILLQTTFSTFGFYKPGVLGVNSQITISQIVDLTNQERAKNNLPPLSASLSLNNAATAKAANMFEENYWAHYSPSGKDPWGFINQSGYKFSYAGENLARNFQTSGDVVKAWMNSPSHRENILNSNYQDIGIAVVDGVLLGQKTTLVVQEFGRPYSAIAAAPPKIDTQASQIANLNLAPQSKQPTLVAGLTSVVPAALVNPYTLSKWLAMALIGFVGTLLVLDVWTLKRRGVFRLSSHHFAHLSFLAFSGVTVMTTHSGAILDGISVVIR